MVKKKLLCIFAKNKKLFDYEKIFIILIVRILMLILFCTGNNHECEHTVPCSEGGQLVIDGGAVSNADITMTSGSRLKIINGGKIIMRTNTNFEVPLGAIVDIQHGEIIRSDDFR